MRLLRKSPQWRSLFRVVGQRLFQRAENNGETRSERNGEGWLLRELLTAHARTNPSRPFLAFDAGANRGGYTRNILEEARRAGCAVEVHAFEPSPLCLELLRQAFGSEPMVRIVGSALADHSGDALLFGGTQGNTLASLVPRPVLADDAADSIRVPLLPLGDYLTEHGIGHVDLLKLDVEGSELAALQGLGDQLRPAVVDVVQFEYGGTTLDAGTSLRQIFTLLAGRGYILGKLLPAAVEMRTYQPWMENYAYANYVAVSPRWQGLDSPGASAR